MQHEHFHECILWVLAKAIYRGTAPPFKTGSATLRSTSATIFAACTALARHTSSRQTVAVGTWHAFIRSRAILWYDTHKNGTNMANNVAKLAEKVYNKVDE